MTNHAGRLGSVPESAATYPSPERKRRVVVIRCGRRGSSTGPTRRLRLGLGSEDPAGRGKGLRPRRFCHGPGRSWAVLTLATVWWWPVVAVGADPSDNRVLRVNAPRVAITDIPFKGLTLTLNDADGAAVTEPTGPVTLEGVQWVTAAGEAAEPPEDLQIVDGRVVVTDALARVTDGRITLRLEDGRAYTTQVRLLPGWQSILPPLIAIAAGLLIRQIVVALGLGVWVGMTLLYNYRPDVGFLRYVDSKLIDVFTDSDNAHVILFSLLLGGLVGIISRSGGTQGIVDAVARYARTARSGQVTTWAMGLFIFFDDYANTLIVGNTMRPITDRLRISREKLAYLVDSTSAPVAGLFIVSTWIGTEAGLIGAAVRDTAWQNSDDGYATLIQSLPYRFYSVFTLAMVVFIAALGRDFGPMHAAECRARTQGKLMRDGARPLTDQALTTMTPPDDVPKRWINAVLPIATVVAVAIGGIYYTGWLAVGDAARSLSFSDVFTKGDSYRALMWSGAVGCILAGGMAWVQRLASIHDIVDAWMTGIRSMLLAIVILILAWSIGSLCRDDLHTGAFIAIRTRGAIPIWAIPSVTFLISGVIAYATGTSYGTMGILIPLVVPYAILASGADPAVVLPTIGAVLAGATFGDHCSPISDTTIMSSMASGCDHLDHVRTQMPYALTAAGVAIVFGYLPAGLGVSPWLLMPLGLAALAAIVWWRGRLVPDA